MPQNSNDDIFSGLEDLGFDNINNVQLYKKEEETKSESATTSKIDETSRILSLLYDREVRCPVCGNIFKARSVKTSAPRMLKKDSDFFIRYDNIDPYFYDIWLCNICGYASMKKDFDKIKSFQIDKVQQNISFKWRGRNYPEIYDVNIAIERYKLSLLNYCVIEAKSSSKAMNCLKLAWMHRLNEDFSSELTFLKQALAGFEDAYYNEDFPIYGMDRYTTMYLIGELNRKVENYEQAMIWFSKIITSPSVPQKLKELARDQKDLIKEADTPSEELTDVTQIKNDEKKGIFSRFFNKP